MNSQAYVGVRAMVNLRWCLISLQLKISSKNVYSKAPGIHTECDVNNLEVGIQCNLFIATNRESSYRKHDVMERSPKRTYFADLVILLRWPENVITMNYGTEAKTFGLCASD